MRKPGLLLWVLVSIWSVAVIACGGDPAAPDRLLIDPPSASIDFGAETTLHAKAGFGTDVRDAGAEVTWVARDPAKLMVTKNADGSALVKGLAPGTSMVEARLGDLTATAAISVGDAPIREIGITPPNPSLARGTMVALTATATFADNTTGDITDSATWTSENTGIASVAADGTVRAVAVGSTMIRAAKDGITGSTMVTVTAAELVSIAVTPTNPSVPKGRTVQLMATGTFTDASTQDLGAMVTWSSANGALVGVNATGLATGANVGTASVTASLGGKMGSTDVTVTPAQLVSLQVTPEAPMVPRGRVQQFIATGTYSDASTQNLTTAVTWSSSNAVIASISNLAGTNGQATALDPGNTVITATMGAFDDSTTMMVTPAVLATIQVAPTNPTIADGRTQQFTATGIFTDATMVDLTGSAAWSSSDDAIATISNAAGSRGLATGQSPGTVTIKAASGMIEGTTTLEVTPAVLVAIGVTPVNPSVAKGLTRQFTATGMFSDATTSDITDTVTWTSATPATATISNAAGSRGLATAVAIGTTQIRAASGAISGTTNLTVTAAQLVSIGVTPPDPTVAKGRTRQMTAMGVYTDASTDDLTNVVTWSSSVETVATVSNAAGSRGLVSTLTVGVTHIVATHTGVTGETVLTVTPAVLDSIDITPALPEVSTGHTLQLTATGVFSDQSTDDLTDQVTWASSDETLATVSNAAGEHGLVSGLTGGDVEITATLGGVVGTTDLIVNNAVLESIEVTPIDDSVAAGRSLQYTATGIFSDGSNEDLTAQVTWSSTDDTVAFASNDPGDIGTVYTFVTGSVTITATLGAISGDAALTVSNAELDSIEVQPADQELANGFDLQYSATGTYSDGSTDDLTTQVTWTSDDEGVATISNAGETEGLAHAEGEGGTTINAELDGVTGSTTLTVTPAVLTDIDVEPIGAQVTVGLDQQYSAMGTYSDGNVQDITEQVTWSSSDDNTAQISNAAGSIGLATGIAAGQVTITAELDGVSDGTDLTVIPAVLQSIEVTPSDFVLAIGITQPYTAMGTYDNGEVLDLTEAVTWGSTNEGAASVSNADGSRGVVTGLGNGDTQIEASLDGVTGSTSLHVTDAILVSVEVSPASDSLALGRSLQFTAQAIYSDATIIDITTQATWSSNDDNVASASNAGGSEGLVQSHATGNVVITAAFDNLEGHADLAVTEAVLDTITVEPLDNPSLPAGLTRDYTAMGTFSDATTQDLTTQVTWETSDENVLQISNAPGSQGQATGIAIGTVTITASLDGVSGTTQTDVSAALVVSIEIAPADDSVALGIDPQFTAMGTFTDNTVSDITTQVVWASDDDAVVSISNAPGSEGLATTHATGVVTITATMDGTTGQTTLGVTPAILVSVEVTPTLPSVALGRTRAFTAMAIYSDGSSEDVTASSTWTSSDESVATISNVDPTWGVATSVTPGLTTIAATFAGIEATTDLTVTPVALESITIAPAAPSVPAGLLVQLTATGHYSDDTEADITVDVTWISGDDAIAEVSNAAGTQGLVLGGSPGQVAITASLDGVTGEVTVEVTAAVLQLIAITPDDGAVPVGRTLALVAEGLYSDGAVIDITSSVTWSTETPTALSVTNVDPRGVVTGLAVDVGIVRATDDATGLFAEVLVDVTPAVLDSITVAPLTGGVAVAGTKQYTATGHYSDLTVRNITADADTLWESSNIGIATVSNAAGSKGLATGVANGGPVNITASQGGKTGTAQLVVAAAPTVMSTTPANNATNVIVTGNGSVVFSVAMAPASLTIQTAAGACSGSIRVSLDDFGSCIGLGNLVISADNKTATVTPTPALSYGRQYKIRVTTAATSALGIPLAADFTLANGFTTATDRPCGTGLIISQVYGGGGNTSAQWNADFVELHNPTNGPIGTGGLAVQYASAAGTSWAAKPLPVATVPAGGYFLVRMSNASATQGAALPAPDHVANPVQDMSGTAGKVALTNIVAALPGEACPAANIIDFVGYGTTANCNEGGANAPAPSNTASVVRFNAGCADGNNNGLDMVTSNPPTPRNSATPAALCFCVANETGVAQELDFCNVQHPPSTSTNAGVATENIYAQVFEAGITNNGSPGAGIACQIGYGAANVNPQITPASFTWVNAAFNVDAGNNDEFKATLTVPAAGSYRYTSRCTRGGTNWTYCDLNGAGSNTNPDLFYDLPAFGVLTVNP